MGLDAGIDRINSKVKSFEEYMNIRSQKGKELSEDDFYKWEEDIFYTNETMVHCFINRIPHSSKTDYDKDESMLITKQDLQFLINKLYRMLKTYKGLKQLDELDDYCYPKKVKKHYSRKWWKEEVLKPLKKILQETDFDKETLFYEAWY